MKRKWDDCELSDWDLYDDGFGLDQQVWGEANDCADCAD